MALIAKRHKDREQRGQIVRAIEVAKARTGSAVGSMLKELGVSRASYYRYRKCAIPKDRKPRAQGAPLTPAERVGVIDVALAHPLTGYKSLTWILQNEAIAGVRSHHVLKLLRQENLIVRREAAARVQHTKPAAPAFPNEVWHIDLMYLSLRSKWWYLVDILDAYSRYLVHWTLNDSMASDTVTLTILEALEMWSPDPKPAIVHDNGAQFVSKEWRAFTGHHGLPSIRIRLAHPQSNGRIERLHRTHREEGLAGADDWSVTQARTTLARWSEQYNNRRPHSALCGLPPVVYYLGEPDAAVAQREHFVQAAAEARVNYWRQHNDAQVSNS